PSTLSLHAALLICAPDRSTDPLYPNLQSLGLGLTLRLQPVVRAMGIRLYSTRLRQHRSTPRWACQLSHKPNRTPQTPPTAPSQSRTGNTLSSGESPQI